MEAGKKAWGATVSKAKRWDTECGYGCAHGGVEYEDGPWVKWEDYAALEAKFNRLLTAGDALDAYLKRQDGTTNGMLACRREWLDAKEGASQ